MDHSVGHAIFFGKLGADLGVLAFDFVSDSLANIV